MSPISFNLELVDLIFPDTEFLEETRVLLFGGVPYLSDCFFDVFFLLVLLPLYFFHTGVRLKAWL